MNSRNWLLAVACILSLLGVNVASADDKGKEETKADSPSIRVAATHAVTIRNFQYSPNPIEVQIGDSITWTNEDAAPHSATRTDSPAFDTGILSRGQSKTITFTTPSGSDGFEYFCTPHPVSMRARVIVRMAASTAFHNEKHDEAKASRSESKLEAPQNVTVRILDQPPYYAPQNVEIEVGGTVTWINDGGLPHTASRDAAPAFDTNVLTTGKTESIRFDQATSAEGLEYFCRPHPYMKGRVIVKLPGSHISSGHHESKK